jgi:hypothetical protein
VNLLLFVLCVAFISGLRGAKHREVPARPVTLVLICTVVAVAYLSQRVI